MDDYQNNLISIFKSYRLDSKYPTYPIYHKGLYLENYFYKWFIDNNIQTNRYYIPVFWTTCYVDNCFDGLQQTINTLDLDKKYFTIAQHDDAIREKLPINTISFNAGGSDRQPPGIPIPLICSPIKNKLNLEKEIFCSFVGSFTHPIRHYLYNALKNNPKYYFITKEWTPNITENDFNNFKNTTLRSVFCLCPRGYGKSSYRFYEAMQLGSIPVYVSDLKWCPFEDEIDWNEFSILIDINNIQNIDSILSSYSKERIKQIQNNLHKYWKKYFTMESVCKKIIDLIKKSNFRDKIYF